LAGIEGIATNTSARSSAIMVEFRRRYRDRIVDILDRTVASQTDALDAARDAAVAALAADRLIHVAGSGHSHLIAEEAFYRAGGIAAAQAILDPDLMLHVSASRSTQFERETGRAERVLAEYGVMRGDVVFVASNSGRNAYPIEMALAAKARGATTVALTSILHTMKVTSRHPSGKRLFEVSDIVLDNGARYGDANLPVGRHGLCMGPTSTIIGVFIINTVLAEAVDHLADRGVTVDIYQSANAQGTKAATDAIIRRWKPRIKGL
jgi:uncharacterized phosphosugar-binding protein